MMNKLMDCTNPKDKFIVETLLPYLVDYIEESDFKREIVNKVSSMYVFPYRTNEGTMLGSLKEPGISWYFDKNKDKKTVSSGGYRIIDDSIMREKDAVNFRKTFNEYCGISEFSDHAVVKDLLEKMSKETDYTSRWWTYAYDVFKLWNKEDFNSSLELATRGMQNNRFLFIEDEYSDCLKQRLLKYGIFSDIKETSINSCFWNFIKNHSDEKKAIEVLKRMGVPYSFVNEGRVNEHLVSFFYQVSKNNEFPIKCGEKSFELCELSHDIMIQIYYEDQESFFEITADRDINGGIVVKNRLEEYVPLSWDVFYLSQDEIIGYEEIEMDHPISKLESLHINEEEYEEKILMGLEQCHEFREVYEPAEDYMLGVGCEIIDFYKWIWAYSQHEELIENILYFYTNDVVPKEDVEFVLLMLSGEKVTDKEYQFDINLEVEDCFKNADILNKISNQFPNIRCSVNSDLQRFDVSKYLSHIITDVGFKNKNIIVDPIWEHVYLVDKEPNGYDDVYVRCKASDKYEDILLLWSSTDNDSYMRALAKYVSEKYHIEVPVACAEAFDWKTEYLKLLKGIRAFITEKQPIVKENEVYGYIANMADVTTFYDERRIWKKLYEQREKIVCQTSGKNPINLENWRNFLASKYKGRCQVCGNKTATGAQNAHFFTYRIKKESENRLANLSSNMFCVCPSCHGEMQYGSYMGKDMNEILEKANLYWEYYDSKCDGGEMEDNYESLVGELADDFNESVGFDKPITCNVIVNGKAKKMSFSWEHFIMLAFVLKESLQFDSEGKGED